MVKKIISIAVIGLAVYGAIEGFKDIRSYMAKRKASKLATLPSTK